jgi:hypothetical protein
MRGRRWGERGSQTLELLAAMPAVGLVMLVAGQALVLGRQQAEAESDARSLARAAVLCAIPSAPLELTAIDPRAADGVVTRSARDGMVSVTVRLPPESILGLDLGSTGLAPSATVTMRHEPC